jgi:ABC-2 type transport system ATP-binding protein
MPTTQSSLPMISVTALCKSYGPARALDNVDLEVGRGQVLALLGPNGAGKTTIVRILATLLKPDSGAAWVGGYDALTEPRKVQAQIGLSGQLASVDDKLTGRDNLAMFGRLQRLSHRDAATRAQQLLSEFGLEEAAGRAVKTYSGGMRRRLDLAASLIVAPPVVFLDEPTSSLDPSARHVLWAAIRALVDKGTTVLLTTHDLDEADQLADSITIIDKGRVIARGSARDLKAQVGRTRFVVTAPSSEALTSMCSLLGDRISTVDRPSRTVSVLCDDRGVDGLHQLRALVDELTASGIPVEEFGLRKPTLDDVFQQLTNANAAVPMAAAKGSR